MNQSLRIEGVYDQRTLKFLKQQSLGDFSFDFSPTSFNFLQKHIFFENFLRLLDSKDRIFLHFSRSNDPMVQLIIEDLKKEGQDLSRIYFEFDLLSDEQDVKNFECNYLISYSANLDLNKYIAPGFKGLVFNVQFFEELQSRGLLANFATNFLTRYHHLFHDESLLILRMDWGHNLMNSIFDFFDFNLISIPINSRIEICYRNVDLKKLSSEIDILRKNTLLTEA